MSRRSTGLGTWPSLLLTCFIASCGSGGPGGSDDADASGPQPTVFEQALEVGLLNDYYEWARFYSLCGDCREIMTMSFEERDDGSPGMRRTIYWPDPGSSGAQPGDAGCASETALTPSPLPGYEDHTRQLFRTETISLTGEGCAGQVGLTGELYIHRVSEELFAIWSRNSRFEDGEFPGYLHERQSSGFFGTASPLFACSDSAKLPNRDYCAPHCGLEGFDNAPTGCGIVPTP